MNNAATHFKRLTLVPLVLAVSGALYAQTADDESDVIEEVVVTGMRASLENALDRKREADQIMDAISAEDIGKFPDENIGEALQRIPGVSLDREAGEGKGVSIRGLGAGLSQVTINGQVMASTEGSREFNYSVLDSSIVSALEVWKSPMASQEEGAVGGTVNIATRGPLDYKQGRLVVNAQAQYEELSDDWGGKYTLNWLTQTKGGSFGFAIDANFSDRVTRSDQVIIPGWQLVDENDSRWSSNNWDDLAAANGLDYLYFPIDISSRVRTYDRQRTGINPTIQWRPNDDMEFTLYGFYSKLEDYDTNDSNQVRLRDVVNGNGRDVLDYDWQFDGNNVSYFNAPGGELREAWRPYRNIGTLRENEWITKGAQLDFEWNVSDNTTLHFAGGSNTGEGDLTTYPIANFFDTVGFEVDMRDDPRFPQVVIEGGGTDDSLMEFRQLNVNDQYDEVERNFLQFDFDRNVGWGDVVTFKAGLKYHDHSTDHTQIRHTNNNVAPDGYSLADFALMCGDTRCVTRDFEYANDTLAPLNGTFTLVDYRGIMDIYPRDSRETAIAFDESYLVEEETYAAYVQFDLDGDLFGIPYRGNAGLRWYDTDLASSGWAVDEAGVAEPVRVDRSYGDWLPSLNLVFVLKEDLLLRLGAAKVIARPDQDDLALAGRYFYVDQEARVGNPYLDPFRAWQGDVSLEWYLSEAGMLQGGVFYKDIDSFISNGVLDNCIPVGSECWDATGPINGEGGTVKGFEASWQQVFVDLPGFLGGFGVQVNYTYTDSDVSIPYIEGGLSYSMPLEGLSKNSANFVLFWENDTFSARAAYNYRDEFLSNRANTQGNPVFTDGYGQLDASANWTINKMFTLSVNAINLNNEARYQYFLTNDRMLAWRASGRRFSIALRARF